MWGELLLVDLNLTPRGFLGVLSSPLKNDSQLTPTGSGVVLRGDAWTVEAPLHAFGPIL
mgnify:CR=1 FL=1